jgi:tetratricopeptide (TPR) repeat protein
MASPIPRWRLATVAAAAILVYANSLGGAFVWDDETQIVRNPRIRTLDALPRAFAEPFWGFAESGRTNFYRPVQTALYALAYSWSGLSPTAYHAISVGMHTLASVLLYLACARLGFAPGTALLAAALFAVHPVHTEAVAWIAGLPDAACGAFYFAALWALLRFEAGRRAAWLGAACGFYLAALFSKEMAITLPVVALLGTFRAGAPAIGRAGRGKLLAALAAPTVIYLGMRSKALGFLATSHLEIEAGLLDWITLGVQALGTYVRYVFVPYPLHAYHMVPVRFGDRMLETLAALALVAGLAAAAWRCRRRAPQAWLWGSAFALMLAPVLYFPAISTALVAERYLYIPSAAAVLLGAAAAGRAGRRAVWAAWAVAALFAIMTVARNRDWRDSERLYLASLGAEPDAAHFHLNLADILLRRGDDAGARAHLSAALAVLDSGRYAQTVFERYRARIGLGALEARAQRFGPAREHFEQARQEYPAGEWAYVYLGGLAMQGEGDDARALEYFREAVRLGPRNEVAHDSLGMALFNVGQVREAIASFERALEINPSYAEARSHLETARRSSR